MALSDHVPGTEAGNTKRNTLVALVYLLLSPLLILVFPFYLLYAVGTNRNGLADSLAESPLARIPPIEAGGWQSAITLFVAVVVIIGALGALAPAETGEDNGVDDGDASSLEADTDTDDTADDTDDEQIPDDTDDEQTQAEQDDHEEDEPDDHEEDEQDDPHGQDTDTDVDDADDDSSEDAAEVDGELELHHIDVGQADSTLIITPDDETILIDTGDWRPAGEQVISYLESKDIDRIDHLVATHPHADHIGGHAAVIEHFEESRNGIGNIYDPGIPHDTNTFDNYLDAVDEYGHELLIVEEGDELPLDSDDVVATVLNPPAGDSGTDLHYNSVSLVVEFGEFRYLTTGDAEDDAEARLLENWVDDLSADVYQAGHHGSSTSSTQLFIDEVDPQMAIISSALDSQYGHPHDEVLERFAEMNIETYWTGVHGDIVVTTDGQTVEVVPAETASTNSLDLLEKKPDDDEENSHSIAGPFESMLPPTPTTEVLP